MLLTQKKKLATLIMNDHKKPDFVQALGEGSGSPSMPTPDGDQNDDSMALESAAQDMIQAFDAKDAKALVSALKNFMSISGSQMPDESVEGV